MPVKTKVLISIKYQKNASVLAQTDENFFFRAAYEEFGYLR